MSIERSQLSQSVEESRKAEGEGKREPASKESVQRFRQVMQEAREEFAGAKGKGEQGSQKLAEAEVAARQMASQDAIEASRQLTGDSEAFQQMKTDPAEMLAMMQVQSALRDGGHAAQAPPTMANPAAFSELLERHVRQLAVGGNTASDRDGQVLLRLADATLPGTDLMLTKTADGWVLRADVRSRDSYDAIQDAAPELARRFAERNLGSLEIASEFHG